MPRRHLFGPVLAEQDRGAPRQGGYCLAFNQAGTTDWAPEANDNREQVRSRLSSGFQNLPAPGELLTSVIILFHNQLPFTRLCLDSVLRHTRAPYELILVDNGSTDGTAEYLEEVRARSGLARVEVIRNETNLGFPAGCNQAAGRARGRFLLFLNNDTIVTEGWLEGLLAWARHDWPKVGLVGPMTNHIGNQQRIPVDYRDLDGLDDFAARRRQACAGQAHEPPMLAGFCLLARRDVFEQVDGFDIRFGLGYLDDDDLSLRVKNAGYRLVAAHDVFVHHFGGRTFAALGIDGTKQMSENFEKFRAKWGDERVQDYHLPPGSRPPDLGELTAEEATGPPRQAAAVLWEGPFLSTHSLALVNRQLCRRLLGRGHGLALFPTDGPEAEAPLGELDRRLGEHLGQKPPRTADVHVRHRWPPDFTPPPAGHWVMIQPWEYGSLPKAWVGPMANQLDELWVPSHYVRECCVQSGVPADRVHVVPNGVDTAQFHPQAPPLPLKTRKHFRFLFVGGTIARKGIDLVLAAYTQTFTAADDIGLVIKDMGVGTFYQGQTAGELIRQCQSRPGAPEIEYLDRPLSGEELAGLYTACDCLVHPYRGEGFGLPIAEAMACALPVIVTGYGAALDFCSAATAYLLPARVVRFPEKRVGDLETVDYPWLAEPDLAVLREYMQHVVEHPTEARVKGHAAWRHVRDHLTWDHAVQVVEQRLQVLRRQPIRRFTAAGVSGTQGVASAASRAGRQRVSLSMIVKNEERNLPACLESVADLVDEIVVVDTGSTDRTKEVAARFGARVFDFAWVDSFAAARNASLRHVTGDWVFWLDADDRLDEDNRRRLRGLLAGLQDEQAAYVMKCLCLPEHDTGAATVVDHVRLFRYHPDLRWEYRVHEQILGSLRRRGTEIRLADVVIQHTGYQDPAQRPRKVERDLRLLRLQDRETPDDPFVLFNLGSLCSELNRPAEALPLLRRSLRRSNPQDSIVRKLYALIVFCHRQLGQSREALAACREGLDCCPEDVELLYTQARLLRGLEDLPGAAACLGRLLKTPPADYFASVDPGLRGYKARLLLGQIRRDQGLHGDAEAAWRAAVDEHPYFGPAWLELGQLYLAQGRWERFDEAVRRLRDQPQLAQEVAVLSACGHLARREFAAARQLLEGVIAREPRAVYPRQLLTHMLLQEGKDWAAAEQALRDVLALDPGHAEARSNLAVLLRQLGRDAEALPAGPTLSELYQAACATASDIHQHCPTLYALAKECRQVTEMGTRTAVSTTALLFAQPDNLVCYDRVRYPQVDVLQALAGRTAFAFHQADVLRVEIEETDLLFIDTWHVYGQLKQELRRHAGKVRKYIVLHDTTTFGEHGETPGHAGLWPAIEEFLAEGLFILKCRYENNNGLTVLERK